ncbi:cilia- and flagella-associated protein 70-like isoform X2 [Paramacrobiotus metropolitanus]|uniref:cilia- and flagella-associated protein 70-like isoform X2 n=1 Tax=Paramacrobiotus metropolitanus TaxID=2943436 RepID=UPI002445F967|nr:cilia- and flagella-associated protein 70-like isoform X2 [Paramacrobiotus metropolitanus]
MSLTVPQAPPTEPWKSELEISLLQLSNLNRAKCKDSGWSLVIRALTIGNAAVETPKLQIVSLTENLNQKIILPVTVQSYQDLDDFVHYPLLLNFYEITAIPPKDKKKPTEDKLDLLGQCSIDTLPFLNGVKEIQSTTTIFSPSGIESNAAHPDSPECKISIRLLTPLIPPVFEQQFNLLTLTVHSCYSLPETWLPPVPTHGAQKSAANASSSGFTFATAFPRNGAVERTLLASNKTIIQRPSQKNVFKKWPSHPLIVTDAIYMTQKLNEKNYAVETGSMCASTDWLHRDVVERQNPCIVVNTEFRCILPSDGEEAFRAKAMARKIWPFELFELTLPEKHPGGKKKANVEATNPDEPVVSRHGVAYVDVKPLLFPGATRIQGAFPIKAYDPNEFAERTHRVSIGADVAKAAGEPSTTISLDTKDTRLSVGSRNRSDMGVLHISPDKSGSNNPKSNPDIPPHGGTQNVEQRKYEESMTYVYLEMKVEKPLILETPKKPIIDRLKQLIKPLKQSAEIKRPQENARLAELSVHSQMERMHNQERMCESGDFHAFKEELKLHIIQLVRNKYDLQPSITNDRPSFHRFLSTLYCDLIRQSRVAFAAVRRSGYRSVVSETTTKTLEGLRMVALESEMDEELEEAEKLMRERTRLFPKDSSAWKELGMFYCRHGDIRKADQAFIECLLDDYSNFEGLVCLGHLKLLDEQLKEASIIFESISILYPDSPLAWTILGLFYEYCGQDSSGMRGVLQDLAYHRANEKLGVDDKKRQNYQEFLRIVEEQRSTEAATGTGDPTRLVPSSPTSRPKSDMDAKIVPSTAPKGGSKKDNKGLLSGVSQADSDKTREPSKPESNFSPISNMASVGPKQHIPVDNIFWTALGGLVGLELHQLAELCISEHLTGSCDTADPVLWRAAVLLNITQKKLTEAESVLMGIMAKDVETADVFAFMGHIMYLQKNDVEAADNYDRALSLSTEVSDPFPLYFRYGRLSQRNRNYEKAYEMYFAAARLQASCKTWLGVGWACYHLEMYSECEIALQEANFLDNKNSAVWAYLAMVNVKFNRRDTAIKCRNAAVVYGIENHSVIFDEMENTFTQIDMQ